MALGPGHARRNQSAVLAALLIALAPVFVARPAAAQQAGIMSPGDTVVSAFSGVAPPVPPFPTGNPLDVTFIDLNGNSVEIQRPQPLGPPAGQLIPSPTVFAAHASDVGQVFAITHDDQPAPDIFVAATSAYGIQIVIPDNNGDGRPERVQAGQPGAMFMDGQWGPGGTAGSIYRIDGVSGAISLFTTIGADTGPGIGDIAYDPASHQFFVSDLDTGLIYRLDSTGLIEDTFDHGLLGRPAAGLPPAADDGSVMDISSPAFHTADPATWGYTQPERRVGALAVYGGRLYYSVASGPQIYSVGINLDGTFANDPRWELDVTGLPSANPVTSIAFDGQGHMLLAQRGAQRGSYDYSVFADPQQSSVVRYRREIPDDPTTPGLWAPIPDTYAIGFRTPGLNTTGGIALGYGYDQNGFLRTGACNEYLWTTGESLRDNPALAATLSAGGPATVHGLQGNDVGLVRPANDPPFSSYFTDYDGLFADPGNQGHVGDVDVWQPCAGGPASYIPPYFPPPGYTPPPALNYDLRIDKIADPGACQPGIGGWLCTYDIRVTNTGPSWYWGPINVDDWLPANPPGAVVTFPPQPPWGCWQLGPNDEQCSYPPVFLQPGDSVDLTVSVQLPANSSACYLANAARIDWPFGTGDADPSDDFASATALVPTAPCLPLPPPVQTTTNLKIDKQATPYCNDLGSVWQCLYLVTVTNTGPGTFDGSIVVTDTLSVADPVLNNAPWTCTNPGPSHTCTFPMAHLAPGDSKYLWLVVYPPKGGVVAVAPCDVSNTAHITAPTGAPQNTIATDDDASADAATPGPNCAPPGQHSDLSIAKRGLYCVRGDQGWACLFGIAVKNEGPDGFFGPVTVKDTFLGFTPLPPSPVFAPPCTPDGSGAYNCSIGPLYIAPNTYSPPIWLAVLVPDNGQVCTIGDRAQIVTPPGLSTTNTNPLNDSVDASLTIPSEQCQPRQLEELQKTNVCPVQQQAPGGSCCPTGQFWNGRACAPVSKAPPCPPGTTGTPPACVANACPAGTSGTPPNCVATVCPPGSSGTYPNCVRQSCPTGTTGTYPNCVQQSCPAGTSGTYPNCVRQACPTGTVGTYPNCVRQACPTGTTGTYPNCVQQSCPAGTSGTYPNCVRQACPAGTTGTYPNCVRQVCPTGTTGTYPNCVQQICPAGTSGTYPNCVRQACPAGTSGTYPNCVRQACPTGTTGTYPNCVQQSCPTGSTGTYPNCRPTNNGIVPFVPGLVLPQQQPQQPVIK